MKNIITRYTKRTTILAIAILVGCGVNAQFAQNYLRAADDYFKKGDYYSAAQYYEKALQSKGKSKTDKFDPYKVESLTQKKANVPVSSHEQAIYRTAESYRMINNYPKAEPYYQQAAETGKFPLARYYYGKSLRYNSKFEDAEKEFTKFLQEEGNASEYMDDSRKEIANLQFIQKEMKKDIGLFTVNKISAEAYTNGADYAPAIVGKSTLVFTSTRLDDKSGDKKNAKNINHLYKGAVANDVTMNAEKLMIPQGMDMHQGVASFSPNGNHAYLTRWSMVDGKKQASVYHSMKTGDTWSEPSLVGGDLNAEGFSSQEPFVSADGKHLLYASDKPGGLGKFDLWMAGLDDMGNPGSSTNLGATINTTDDERAPYYHASNATLIFSTNGRVGMGGFDFFQSKSNNLSSFEAPVNLGYPVNSVKDDIYMASTGDKRMLDNVFFSSDRNSPCCLEMYTLNLKHIQKIISGLVVDCATGEPINGASVAITDPANNSTISSQSTNMAGQYSITLDEYQPLQVTAKADGYEGQKSLAFNSPANMADNKLTNPSICLAKPVVTEPIVVMTPVVMNDIFFEFDKYVLKPGAIPALDSLVAFMERYPNMEVEISAHTDALGDDSYNQSLSELRAKSVIEYLTSKGVVESRLQSKGYGETQPVAPNTKPNGKDDPEGRAKNRRVEFKILHY